jgi:hypothetical protein
MTPPRPPKRYRCCYCGRVFDAWLPVAGEPDGAMLLGHLSHQHPDRVGAYLPRMVRREAHPWHGTSVLVFSGGQSAVGAQRRRPLSCREQQAPARSR